MAVADTPNLGLDRLDERQDLPEITHNEALNALDAIVMPSVKDRDLNAPPGSPAEGDRYIVGPSPTGAWAGQAGKFTRWYEGWKFHTVREGWAFWVDDENKAVVWNGASYQDVGGSGVLNNLSATTNPTAGDDTGDGYSVGSIWINVTTDRIWQAVDVSAAAAIWRELGAGIGPYDYRNVGVGGLELWYPGCMARGDVVGTDITNALDEIHYWPYWTGRSKETLDRIAMFCRTTSAGSMRMGIYKAAGPSDIRPSARILDAGTVSWGGSTGVKSITISQVLEPNSLYYLAQVAQTAACISDYFAPYQCEIMGHANTLTVGSFSTGFWSSGAVSGALPDPAAATVLRWNGSASAIFVRLSSGAGWGP